MLKKKCAQSGKPDRIVLEADRSVINADGKDLSFITVSVVDKNDNPCPNANHLVKFNVSGEGVYRAGANGDATCLDLFHLPQMHLFSGKLTAIVEATETPGKIVLKASAKRLSPSKIEITTK